MVLDEGRRSAEVEIAGDSFLARAVSEGLAQITGTLTSPRIHYQTVDHSERFSDPEEQVRAEFWAELIYRYGYPPERIGVEVIVPDRTPHDAADLVVFTDDDRKTPYAIIECKRDAITDAEFLQAIEQAVGNGTWAKLRAAYVGVVAGGTRLFLDLSDEYGIFEREKNVIADLPREYGKPQEFKYYKGGRLDIAPVDKQELIVAIKKCHQTLWGGGRLSPPAAFGELCKIIFVKTSDEKTPRKKGEPYEFQIKTHEPSRDLARRIHGLYSAQMERDPDVFNEPIRISDAQLRTLVSHLEGVSLTKTDLDTKGVAFEQFMDGFFKGDFGQYFTPRELIDFCIEIIRPSRDDLILDPACGSGGFLLHALDFVRKQASAYYSEGTAEHHQYWHQFAQRNLYGIEINDEIARVAKMNMILHDDGHTNVVGADALESFDALIRLNPGLAPNRFDLVLTNPPFGAQVIGVERPYLGDYVLGRQKSGSRERPRRSQKTEILFVERVLQFLRPGTGRAAIVLPDGILTNASLQYVRDFMLEGFQILAVVSLPAGAFAHFGAGVKASIVFVRRRGPEEAPSGDERVFMAAPLNIGYDATGRKTRSDLPEVIEAYREFVEAG